MIAYQKDQQEQMGQRVSKEFKDEVFQVSTAVSNLLFKIALVPEAGRSQFSKGSEEKEGAAEH